MNHETPFLTTDIIIEMTDQPGQPIVLIERRYPPLGWAFPGGFVERGERIEQAAIREAAEETGLHVELHTLLGIYSDPQRDPRMHTASAVYIASAQGEPMAADDACDAIVIHAEQATQLPLAFDHALILADYLQYRQRDHLAPLRVK